jgi:hypothetical protein
LHAHQYTPFFYAALARMTGAWRTKILMTEHGRFYPDIVSWKRRLTNRFVLTRACDHATAPRHCGSTTVFRRSRRFTTASTSSRWLLGEPTRKWPRDVGS